LLLLVDDGDNVKAYIEMPYRISEAVKRDPKKKWDIPRLGNNPIVVYDELKRMLVIVSVPGQQVRQINYTLQSDSCRGKGLYGRFDF
jgi:hypothetical protein